MHILKGLHHIPHLTTLDLKSNGIRNKIGAGQISLALQHVRHLTTLNLEDSDMEDDDGDSDMDDFDGDEQEEDYDDYADYYESM